MYPWTSTKRVDQATQNASMVLTSLLPLVLYLEENINNAEHVHPHEHDETQLNSLVNYAAALKENNIKGKW